jgi:alpha-L-fucosidase
MMVLASVGLATDGGGRQIAPGPFQPTWESLEKNYQCPEWFRDAKFGIWAHWSVQCVPEQGDWYARHMYIQGMPQYNYHVKTYGHPSKVGFMELDNLWKAEKWDPERLMALYKRAGAKYFVALANHHDNFDAYDSKYHAWNSVNVGPKKDIVGTWAKIARANGLRFGVSNHSAHAWHWFQTAYGYDGEGALAGVRYDAFTLTKADGQGKWWEGLDPQDLYTGRNIVMPDGISGAKAIQQWHEKNDRPWTELPPAMNPKFTETWFLRCQDLVDKYNPDLLYFDNIGDLPLGQAGLDIAAHFYNANKQRHDGKLEAVLNVKGLDDARRPAVVEDYERGSSDVIQAAPWQTDTCIGDWHYNRGLFEQHRYKSVAQVVRMLVNIVSKNGNLLLSIPVRGNGTIDEDEVAFLEGMAKWMEVNGEGIFGTRPWTIFGEGPAKPAGGMFNENRAAYGEQDIRFTRKGNMLYAFCMAVPTKDVRIKSLGKSSTVSSSEVSTVQLLGSDEKLSWTQEADALAIRCPAKMPCEHAITFRIAMAPVAEVLSPAREPDVIFVPTPQEVVDKMLEMAEIKPNDVVYDLGCGNGIILVTAAKKYGVKAVGFDINPERIKEALEKVRANHVEDLVTIKQADIFTLDLSEASVVTLYLLPTLNVKLMPQLEKLKPGSRIVSHDFDMRGAKPVETVTVSSENGRAEHTVYKWVVPWETETSTSAY